MKRVILHVPTGEVAVNLLLAFFIGYTPMLYSINEVVNRFIQYGAWWDSAFVMGVFIIVLLIGMPTIAGRQDYRTILFTLCVLALFGVTIFLNTDGAIFAKNNLVSFFIQTFPAIYLGYAVKEFEHLERVLILLARVVTVAVLIWCILVIGAVNDDEVLQSYMAMSYSFLPCCMICTYSAFKEKNITNILFFVLSLVLVVILGTRGPMLFACIFVCLCILRYSSQRNRVFICIGLLVSVGIFVYYFMDIVQWLYDFSLERGIRNNGLHKILYAKDITNGRTDLYAVCIEKLKDAPILGRGIYADRKYIGGYVHLLPLELCLNFGLVIGTILFIALMGRCFYVLSKSDQNDIKWLLIISAFFIGVCKLFASGSYLEEPYFYLLIGILMRPIHQKREKL